MHNYAFSNGCLNTGSFTVPIITMAVRATY